jgi:hypothetical protein
VKENVGHLAASCAEAEKRKGGNGGRGAHWRMNEEGVLTGVMGRWA